MTRRAQYTLLLIFILSTLVLSACRARTATPSILLAPAPSLATSLPTSLPPEIPPAASAAPTDLPPTPTATSLPTDTPLPTATPAPTPASGEILPLILAAFEAQEDRSWRYTSDIRMENGETHTTLFEFVPPDRYHILSDGQSEVIGTGGKVYIKQDGAWAESPVQPSSIIDPQFSDRLEQTISDLQFTGYETIDGVPMLVFQYRSTYKIAASEVASQTTLWLGQDDNLLYRILIDGEVAALDHSTGAVTNSKAITTIIYEYDPSIQIDVPVVAP
jgi:hypothetical protein